MNHGNSNSQPTPIRVLVAETSPVARRALETELGAVPGVEIIAWCTSGAMVVDQVHALKPDLVVLGLDLGGVDGIEVYGALRVVCPNATVLIFDTMFRAGQVSAADHQELDRERLAFMASYVVATQLIPKVRSVFRSSVGVEGIGVNEG